MRQIYLPQKERKNILPELLSQHMKSCQVETLFHSTYFLMKSYGLVSSSQSNTSRALPLSHYTIIFDDHDRWEVGWASLHTLWQTGTICRTWNLILHMLIFCLPLKTLTLNRMNQQHLSTTASHFPACAHHLWCKWAVSEQEWLTQQGNYYMAQNCLGYHTSTDFTQCNQKQSIFYTEYLIKQSQLSSKFFCSNFHLGFFIWKSPVNLF